MKKSKTTGDVARDYAKSGKRMAIQPKKGQSSSKNVKVGNATATMKNGIYTPRPTTGAKKATPAPKKPKWKAPSSRKTGLKGAMKRGNKGKRC